MKNDANGQIISSMGFHPVGQARVIRSVVHLREEANLQPLAKALKGITTANAEYKINCKGFERAKKNFAVVGGRTQRTGPSGLCRDRPGNSPTLLRNFAKGIKCSAKQT